MLLVPLLAGCAAISDVAGLAAGGAAGSATANPVVGYAVGITVRAGVDELRKYAARERHAGEQDAIAEAAGDTPIDQVRRWEIRHTIPVGNVRGFLVPVRDIRTPLAHCREVLFSADDDGVFTAALCRQADGWAWASAEPATERWGFLQ